jgi:membrane-bound ClpP family serine protease
VRRRRRAVGGLLAGTALAAAFIAPVLAQGTSGVLVIDVDGPITPVIADHLAAVVDQAVGEGALMVVTLDTPGGLDTSMPQAASGVASRVEAPANQVQANATAPS